MVRYGGTSDSELDERIFIRAVRENNVSKAEQLIESGISINCCGIDRDNCCNATTLYISAEYGHLDMVKLLVSRGADKE